jgi:hypothetical protein
MLNAFYTLMLILTGDLNTGILRPFNNTSDGDAAIIQGWLDAGSSNLATQNRGIWVIGDGFIESLYEAGINTGPGTPNNLAVNYFRAGLFNPNWQGLTSVPDAVVDLNVFGQWLDSPNKTDTRFGMRNVCTWSNDVLQPIGTLSEATSRYEKKGGVAVNNHTAGVFKDWGTTSRFKSLVDGWDIVHLTSRNDRQTVERSGYMYMIFTKIWSKIWNVTGTPLVPLDVPTFDDGSLVNFVNVFGNPMYQQAKATIKFGLARADRASINVYDVGGRLIRTLADRQFAAGTHEVVWDGLDNGGRQVPRGVYFTQVKFAVQRYETARKLIVLQ